MTGTYRSAGYQQRCWHCCGFKCFRIPLSATHQDHIYLSPMSGSPLRDLFPAKRRRVSETEHVSSQVLAGNLEAEGYFPALPSGSSPQALTAKAAETKSTISSESNPFVMNASSLLSSAAGAKAGLYLVLS